MYVFDLGLQIGPKFMCTIQISIDSSFDALNGPKLTNICDSKIFVNSDHFSPLCCTQIESTLLNECVVYPLPCTFLMCNRGWQFCKRQSSICKLKISIDICVYVESILMQSRRTICELKQYL